MNNLVIKYRCSNFCPFSQTRLGVIKHNLIVCPMISSNLNDTFVQQASMLYWILDMLDFLNQIGYTTVESLIVCDRLSREYISRMSHIMDITTEQYKYMFWVLPL